MPFFVYRVTVLGPVRRLESLGAFAAYSSAAAECRRLRGGGEGAGARVRLIFAENELQAEELLSEARAAEPNIADDY
jgi:hypothetical protein